MIDLKNIYFLQIVLNDNTFNRKLDIKGLHYKDDINDCNYNAPIKVSKEFTSNNKYYYYKGYVKEKDNLRYRAHIMDQISCNYVDLDPVKIQEACLYRTPKLDLPQIKVQNLKDKYNVKITRNADKADYIITSNKYLDGLFTWTYAEVYNIQDIREYVDYISQNINESCKKSLDDFMDYIEKNDPEAYVYLNIEYDSWNWKPNIKNVFKLNNTVLNVKGADPWYCKDVDSYESIKNASENDKVISDSDVLNFCNEDSIIIGNEDCKRISEMIKSDDAVTMSLALEMMANCNIEKSYDKIALIFAFYGDVIRYTSNWNTVNVKSLRKQMRDIRVIDDRNGWGYNNLVKILHNKGFLTKFAVAAISNKMCNTILSYAGLTSDESVFDIKPKDLKLKAEYEISDLPF